MRPRPGVCPDSLARHQLETGAEDRESRALSASLCGRLRRDRSAPKRHVDAEGASSGRCVRSTSKPVARITASKRVRPRSVTTSTPPWRRQTVRQASAKRIGEAGVRVAAQHRLVGRRRRLCQDSRMKMRSDRRRSRLQKPPGSPETTAHFDLLTCGRCGRRTIQVDLRRAGLERRRRAVEGRAPSAKHGDARAARAAEIDVVGGMEARGPRGGAGAPADAAETPDSAVPPAPSRPPASTTLRAMISRCPAARHQRHAHAVREQARVARLRRRSRPACRPCRAPTADSRANRCAPALCRRCPARRRRAAPRTRRGRSATGRRDRGRSGASASAGSPCAHTCPTGLPRRAPP